MSCVTLNWSKTVFRFLLLFFIITASIFTISTYNYITLRNSIIDAAKKKAAEETKNAAKEINDFLKFLAPIVNSLADDISSGKTTKDDILKRIQSKAEDVTGIGVEFVPFGYDPTKKLFAPYYVEKDGKEQLVQLETVYDYTVGDGERYSKPMKIGPTYLEPFLDKGSNSIVAEYAAPFFDKDKKSLGVAFANHSTTHIQNVIQNLSLGTTGYGFVISKNGTFVAHPVKEYAQNLKTIFQLAKETHSPQLESMAKDATSGKDGYINYTDQSTKQDAWMFFEPITENGWSMVGVFIKNELNLNTDDLRHKRIHIMISLIYALMLLACLIFRIYQPSPFRLWICSIIITILTLIGIIFMWHLAYTGITAKIQSTDSTIIRDRTSLNRFLETATQEQTPESNTPLADEQNHAHDSSTQDTQAKVMEDRQAAQATTNQESPSPIDHSHAHHIDTHGQITTDPTILKNIQDRLNSLMNNLQQSEKNLTQSKPLAPAPTVMAQSTDNAESLLTAVTKAVEPLMKNIKDAEKSLSSTLEQKAVEPQAQTVATTTAIVSQQAPIETTTTHNHAEITAPVTTVASTEHQHDAHNHGEQPTTAAASAHAGHGGHGGHAGHGAPAHHHEGHMHIPTGLYMHHLEFKGANSVNIIAHVWQRYAKEGSQTQVKPGIIFPVGDVKITPAYEFEDVKWKVTGWGAQGNIDQPFKYDTYPFDTKLVTIQMWPNDFDKEVILVVDLDSYKVINPTALPGINPFIKIDGWQIEQSFFSYKRNRYFTNFGFYIDGPFGAIDKSTKSKTPELYFNVILRRHIFSSLLLSLFPIIVVLIILFIQLFTMAKQIVEDVTKVLTATIPLFFTVIAAHTQFKSAVPVQQIIFFEYFYFLLYFLIVVVILLTFFNYWYKGLPAAFYENLFLPLIAYWPFVTTVIFALTLIYFY